MTFQKSLTVFEKTFSPFFLLGIFILSFFEPLVQSYAKSDHEIIFYGVIPLLNAFLTLLSVKIGFYFILKYIPHSGFLSLEKRTIYLTSFLAGLSSPFIGTAYGIYPLGIFILFLILCRIRSFLLQAKRLLQRNDVNSRQDVIDFLSFFLHLIIAFSVINLLLQNIDHRMDGGHEFNFGLGIYEIFNTIYFTIATVTTVGYGDIVPQTYLSKMIIAFECLISYVTFGLMIGIITKGVNFHRR